jgi:hypothetical protein
MMQAKAKLLGSEGAKGKAPAARYPIGMIHFQVLDVGPGFGNPTRHTLPAR